MYLFITLQHYVELNSQYVKINKQNLQNDYLSMMSAPNYSNIIAPHETQHEHVNRWVWAHKTENDNISTGTKCLIISNISEYETCFLGGENVGCGVLV